MKLVKCIAFSLLAIGFALFVNALAVSYAGSWWLNVLVAMWSGISCSIMFQQLKIWPWSRFYKVSFSRVKSTIERIKIENELTKYALNNPPTCFSSENIYYLRGRLSGMTDLLHILEAYFEKELKK